jgi:hypothetical protein
MLVGSSYKPTLFKVLGNISEQNKVPVFLGFTPGGGGHGKMKNYTAYMHTKIA